MTARIAVAFEFGSVSGGEHSMLAAFDRLSRDLFEFVALAPSHGPLAEALARRAIPHIPLELRNDQGTRLPRPQACSRLVQAVEDSQPDLLHANSLAMARLTGAVADRLPIPVTGHLRDILKLSRAALADLNRNRSLVAVSRAVQCFHLAQGLDAGRVRVLYNGVDCRRFHPRPSQGWLRRELGLPEDRFLVAAIGQICLRKGQDTLAEAAVQAAGRLPKTHYLLVGERYSAKAESIELDQEITRRFEQAGFGGRLHRLGYRREIPPLMNELDLLVHPARQEPLGRVLLEAGASGLPLIATRVGGTEEIFGDGMAARLVPPDDPSALAAALEELAGDARQRSSWAAAARRRIETCFNIDSQAKPLADLWSQMLEES